MKGTENSVLAWRLAPLKKTTKHSAWSEPLMVACGLVFVVAGVAWLAGSGPNRPAFGLAAVVSVLVAAMNYRTLAEADPPRQITEEHPDWDELVEKIIRSPNEEERDHLLLGTICEEFE